MQYRKRASGIVAGVATDHTESPGKIKFQGPGILFVYIPLDSTAAYGKIHKRRAYAASLRRTVDKQHLDFRAGKSYEAHGDAVLHKGIKLHSREIFRHQGSLYLRYIIFRQKEMRRPHGSLPHLHKCRIIIFSTSTHSKKHYSSTKLHFQTDVKSFLSEWTFW